MSPLSADQGSTDTSMILSSATPNTPYGETFSPISVGEIGGRRIAFVARHGADHQWAPHRVNPEPICGPGAVGSLHQRARRG